MVPVAKRGNNYDYSLIPQTAWHIPKDYEEWASERGIDAETHLTHLFCQATLMYEQAQYGMARVQVTKGDLTATFSIDPRRMVTFSVIVMSCSGSRAAALPLSGIAVVLPASAAAFFSLRTCALRRC
jgi:hypothetical protein